MPNLSIPPYSLAYDGGQWVVNKTINKTKTPGERDTLVGYYANLQHALYFGVMHDSLNGGAYTTAQGAVDQMVEVWAQVQAAAGPWHEAAVNAYVVAVRPLGTKQAVGV